MTLSFTMDTRVLENIIRQGPEAIERFLDEESETMKNHIIRSFGTSPAPPDNPPGVDTGTLRNSIVWERDGAGRRKIGVGTDADEYAKVLELGSTRHHFKWPFIGPALEWERGVFAAHARDHEWHWDK